LTKYKQKASTMFSELLSEVRQKVIGTIFRYRPVMPEANTKAQIGKGEDLPIENNTALNTQASVEPEAVTEGKKKRKRH